MNLKINYEFNLRIICNKIEYRMWVCEIIRKNHITKNNRKEYGYLKVSLISFHLTFSIKNKHIMSVKFNIRPHIK